MVWYCNFVHSEITNFDTFYKVLLNLGVAFYCVMGIEFWNGVEFSQKVLGGRCYNCHYCLKKKLQVDPSVN